MSRLKAKTTIYLNPYVKKFVQHKAVEENRSISVIINNKLADMLEELADQKAKGVRKKKVARFESVLKRAGLSYDDLRV
jgi:hypothetical protein